MKTNIPAATLAKWAEERAFYAALKQAESEGATHYTFTVGNGHLTALRPSPAAIGHYGMKSYILIDPPHLEQPWILRQQPGLPAGARTIRPHLAAVGQ